MSMTKKDRFLQIVQTMLLAMAPHRRGGLASAAICSGSIMARAQMVIEECLPKDLYDAADEFLLYSDDDFRLHRHKIQRVPWPEWLKYEDS